MMPTRAMSQFEASTATVSRPASLLASFVLMGTLLASEAAAKDRYPPMLLAYPESEISGAVSEEYIREDQDWWGSAVARPEQEGAVIEDFTTSSIRSRPAVNTSPPACGAFRSVFASTLYAYPPGERRKATQQRTFANLQRRRRRPLHDKQLRQPLQPLPV